MAVKCEFMGAAQQSNERLWHRMQQLQQKLQHLCASLLFKEAEIAYSLPNALMLVKICKYRNIGSVSALKYWKFVDESNG